MAVPPMFDLPRVGRSLDDVEVAEAMHPGVITVHVTTPLREVARIMATQRVHCVVVLGTDQEADVDLEGGLWGVVSDLDLISDAALDELQHTTAGSAAVTPIVLIAPDDTLRRAAHLMHKHKVTHLVVADRGAVYPLGVLSTLDIARVLM